MMPKSSIVVFAEEDRYPFYKAFAAGLESTEVHACHEGPAWVRSGKANLVLIDFGFKSKLGLRLLKEVKRANPDTLVMIIAEKSSEESVIEAFQSGARYYLRKPVSVSGLRRIAIGLLKLKRETSGKRSPHIDDGEPLAVPADDVSSGKPANLLRAVQFIEENLGEPIDLETCAKEGCLSKFQFCRVFKRHFGMPPMRFVNHLRVSRAQDLLRRDDFSIMEIALNVGFNSYGSFIKVFKRYTGVLPREFRNSAKAGPRA